MKLFRNTRGSITVYLLVIIVIIGSIAFVDGIFPHLNSVDIGEENTRVEFDGVEEEATGAAENALRLRTIKFAPCAGTAAVTMQLDITGSMGGVIGDLKEAVFAFTDQLSDNSVIGIQAYSTRNARFEVVPVDLYGNNKDLIQSEVAKLTANGRTPTYEALQFSGEILQSAITEYPDREFAFIFFSDGNPNEGPATVEDISQAAQGIKDLGVTVFAIGLGNVDTEVILAIASSPQTAFATTDSKDLEAIYSQISTDLCESGQPEE